VIVFDFQSKFDGGIYGQSVAEMFWKKLERRDGFVLPESMLEVREWCQANGFAPNADTPVDKVQEAVRKGLAGDVGIWGKVERVAGFDTDIYDLWIFVVDFSVAPARILHKQKVRTKTAAEIPHLYVKEALDALCSTEAVGGAGPDPAAEERWAKGPNLMQGDFEKGRGAPAGWNPLPTLVRWVHENGKDGNRIVRFVIPEDVAETTGVLYYSDYFPVEPGARYRFACRWRTTGTAAKVFVKCYDDVPGNFKTAGPPCREVYRSQQNLAGPANTWNQHMEEFTPEHDYYRPRYGRVMLYAYYPAGTVEWDDVVVKQIAPPPASKARSSQGDRP
jgi:hypothetical protein